MWAAVWVCGQGWVEYGGGCSPVRGMRPPPAGGPRASGARSGEEGRPRGVRRGADPRSTARCLRRVPGRAAYAAFSTSLSFTIGLLACGCMWVRDQVTELHTRPRRCPSTSLPRRSTGTLVKMQHTLASGLVSLGAALCHGGWRCVVHWPVGAIG